MLLRGVLYEIKINTRKNVVKRYFRIVIVYWLTYFYAHINANVFQLNFCLEFETFSTETLLTKINAYTNGSFLLWYC